MAKKKRPAPPVQKPQKNSSDKVTLLASVINLIAAVITALTALWLSLKR